VQILEEEDEAGGRKARESARRDRLERAHAIARAIDWTAFDWFWIEGGRSWERHHDQTHHTVFDGTKAQAAIPAAIKREVASRDGWRCRYCGLRVVSPATMTALERLLPAALPYNPAEMGPASVTTHAMQCVLRLTWDHVHPHAAGGGNDLDNLVASCGGCNFNKGNCSLAELGLEDPRDRMPAVGEWDGLNGRLGARPL
jgi:hypothetical protein